MQHHEQLSAQVTGHSSSHRPDAALLLLLVTFDLQLVPVTQEHGVDVVGKVRRGKQDVGVRQPMPEQETGSQSEREMREAGVVKVKILLLKSYLSKST